MRNEALLVFEGKNITTLHPLIYFILALALDTCSFRIDVELILVTLLEHDQYGSCISSVEITPYLGVLLQIFDASKR